MQHSHAPDRDGEVTLVVRWETDAECISYDMPSMVCTVRVQGEDSDALDLALELVAERIVAAYPDGPSGEEPIERSWVFEDDALCMVEAVFSGAPALVGAWSHSEVI